MDKVYLQVEMSTGNLFEYSKTEKEGFEPHTSTNTSGESKKSFRRYFKEGLFAKYKGFLRKKDEFNGKTIPKLVLVFEDLSTRYILEIGETTTSGRYSDFVVSFVSFLPALVVDEVYRVFPYSITEGKRTTKGISFKYGKMADPSNGILPAYDKDTKLPGVLTFERFDSKTNETIPGDIPRLIFTKIGDDKWNINSADRDAFIYKMLSENVSESVSSSNVETFTKGEESAAPVVNTPVANPAIASNTASATKSTAVQSEVSGVEVEEEDEDFPF